MKKIYLDTLKPEEIVRRLKLGDVIHQVDDGYITKMIDGVICEFVGNELVVFNKQLHIDECDFKDLYFEEKEEFKVKKTGLYMTRDGRVAYVSSIKDTDNNSYPVVAVVLGDVETTTWSIKGKRYDTKESGEDLIEYLGE